MLDHEMGARVRASLDPFENGQLRGWVVDLSRPREPIAVDIEVNGVVIEQTVTLQRRLDLDGFFPQNLCGFQVDLSTCDSGLLIDALSARAPRSAPTLALIVGEERIRIPCAKSDLIAQIISDIEERTRSTRSAKSRPVTSPIAPRAPSDDAFAYRGEAEPPALSDLVLVSLFSDVAKLEKYALDVGGDMRLILNFILCEDIRKTGFISDSLKAHAAAISRIFDAEFYGKSIDPSRQEVSNPLLHYLLIGWREGKSPHPLFDISYYRRQVGDLREEPLLHYLREGADAGRDPHPLFDSAFYLKTYLGGVAEPTNPLEHYIQTGGAARLDPSPWFRTRSLLENALDPSGVKCPLITFLGDPACHDAYVFPAFDAKLYRYQWEVERGEKLTAPPLVHYLTEGFKDETLLPNILFDPAYYREKNELAFEGPALIHYLTEGDARGLSCHPHFSTAFYNEQRGGSDDALSALEHAHLNPGSGWASDPRMERLIDPKIREFARALVVGGDEIDIDVYRSVSHDISDLTDEAAAAHYIRHGREEGRPASRGALMRKAGLRIRDLELGFVADDYLYFNRDLESLPRHFMSLFAHYVLYGRNEKAREIGRWRLNCQGLEIEAPTVDAPFAVGLAGARGDICIIIHLYYTDLWSELISFARNFRDFDCDVFVNIVDLGFDASIYEEVRSLCPGAFLMFSHDAGRDVGGLTRILDHIDPTKYELVAFMHSKKSPHFAPEKGDYWRRSLLRAIAGTPSIARQCVERFRADPRVGMIGAEEWRSSAMGANADQYEKLLDLLGVEGAHRDLDYLGGFMFLARSAIIERLYSVLRRIEWEHGADKGLDFHVDGQIAHGVERALPALVRQMGYHVEYR